MTTMDDVIADLTERRDARLSTLITLGNTLQEAQRDCENFIGWDEVDRESGVALLATLQTVAGELAALIDLVDGDITVADVDPSWPDAGNNVGHLAEVTDHLRVFGVPHAGHLDSALQETAKNVAMDIDEDVAAGVVPTTIDRWGDLHNHRDANLYGNSDHLDQAQWEQVTAAVHDWLHTRPFVIHNATRPTAALVDQKGPPE